MEEVKLHEWYNSNLTNNKRYTKVNKYEALLTKENSNDLIKSIKYKKKLIKYEEDYEGFDSYQD